jgi:hypothetical protein
MPDTQPQPPARRQPSGAPTPRPKLQPGGEQRPQLVTYAALRALPAEQRAELKSWAWELLKQERKARLPPRPLPALQHEPSEVEALSPGLLDALSDSEEEEAPPPGGGAGAEAAGAAAPPTQPLPHQLSAEAAADPGLPQGAPTGQQPGDPLPGAGGPAALQAGAAADAASKRPRENKTPPEGAAGKVQVRETMRANVRASKQELRRQLPMDDLAGVDQVGNCRHKPAGAGYAAAPPTPHVRACAVAPCSDAAAVSTTHTAHPQQHVPATQAVSQAPPPSTARPWVAWSWTRQRAFMAHCCGCWPAAHSSPSASW